MPILRHPARVVVAAFVVTIALGTMLLMLPAATTTGNPADPVTALFTATSAVCVTGLIVVDTPAYWSLFGELVILGLIQIGGFGIMTLASLLGLLVIRRLGLRMQLTAQAEKPTLSLSTARRVVFGVAYASLLFESLTAVALTLRLWTGYGQPFGQAAYLGGFHAVSAFNQAGFSLYSDSLSRFVTDPLVCVPVAVAVLAGGLGFPVLFELSRQVRQPQRWSLHAKLTLGTTAVLLVLSTIAVTATEWTNDATLGQFRPGGRLLAGFFQAVAARSAGLNTVDVAEMRPDTLLSLDVFMFIGGGSASTAGGIKVTTFALLAFVIWAEVRGEPEVHALGKRLPSGVQRQALGVALVSVGAVVISTYVLLSLTSFNLDRVLFESVSAFGTVGLSTGITGELPVTGELLLVVLMVTGRLGPITFASALALRERARRYELPEERPIVG